MIILDTNVLSALMRGAPEAQVVAWLDRQPAESVWITSVTLFEARLGLALLPSGRRRQALEQAFANVLDEVSKTGYWTLTVPRRSQPHHWQPSGRRRGDRLTFATRRSPASRLRGMPHLRRETCGIFAT